MTNDSPSTTFVITTGILVAVFIIMLCGFMIGQDAAQNNHSDFQRKLIGANVVQTNCGDRGCSFLVERSNGSREWIWVRRVLMEKE